MRRCARGATAPSSRVVRFRAVRFAGSAALKVALWAPVAGGSGGGDDESDLRPLTRGPEMNRLAARSTSAAPSAAGRISYGVAALAATIVAVFLAHQASLLLHEWTHGTVAWAFGYKRSPFDIHYGGWTLLDADEAIDYRAILAAGKGTAVAAIAIAPILLGGALYVLGTPLLALRAIQRRKALWLFLFWFNLSNLGQVLDYIPMRAFVVSRDGLLRGDVGHFVQGLGVSPWVALVPGILFLAAALFWQMRWETPRAYAALGLERRGQTALLALTLLYLFGWYGMAGASYEFPSNVLSRAGLVVAVVLFLACRPRRRWVADRVASFAAAGKG
jgi:hypothetical protein